MSGIYGQTYIDSFRQDGPLCSWESRLRERLARLGSPESALIWKEEAMPHGAPLSRLARSALHTNVSDCSLWPTPTRPSGGQVPPDGTTATGKTPDGKKVQVTLQNVVHMSLWPTPTVNDERQTAYSYDQGDKTKPRLKLLGLARGALWPRLPASANENRTTQIAPSHGKGHGIVLAGLVCDTAKMRRSGAGPYGSTAQTVSSGVLNPAFTCWLMGLPQEWLEHCPGLAMPSLPKSRKKSSRHTSKRSEADAQSP